MTAQAEIDAFNKKVTKMSDRMFRGSVISIVNEAIRNTPVRTGRLRANWQVGFGYFPGEQLGWTDEVTAAAGMLAQQFATMRAAAAANSGRNATFAFITNNLPYAVEIEEGCPLHGPHRMLARAIQAVTNAL